MRPGVFKAVLAMSGIFVAGAVAGGFGGVWWEKENANRISAQSFVDGQMRRWVKELELTGEQVECIKPIMLDYADKLRNARRKAFAEVDQVWSQMNVQLETQLKPEQVQKFREFLERDRERMEKERERRSSRSSKESEKASVPAPAPSAN